MPKGVPVSDEVGERFSALRKFFAPLESLTRLETFAKWLFLSVATVGTLGVAFSTAGFIEPQRLGKWTFALAVALAGVSLAFAAYSLAPKWVAANLNSPDSLESALAEAFALRRGTLEISAWCFAGALVFAGLSPVASNWDAWWEPVPTSPVISMTLSEQAELSLTVDGRDLEPFSLFTARAALQDADSEPTSGTAEEDASRPAGEGEGEEGPVTLPFATTTADADGSASLTLDLSVVDELPESLVVAVEYQRRGDSDPLDRTFPVDAESRSTASEPESVLGTSFTVILRGKSDPLSVQADSYSTVGRWIEFVSADTGRVVQVLRLRASDVRRIQQTG